MSNDLHLDTETFNEVPIKHGAHRYAEDAEVMLVASAWNEEPVDVWDTQDRPHWREELQEMVDYADRVIIHNAPFDRTVLAEQGVHIPVDKIEDTMVLALTHGLPAKLEMLGEVLGLEADKAKDKDGKRLIQLFTKPRPKNTKLRRATRETHPYDWRRFISYAGRDVDAMRSVYRLLPRWNWTDRERYLWHLDQAINDRGVAIDLDLADAAVGAFERDSRRMAALARELTGGAITSLTQRDRFLAYIRDKGVDLPDLTKGTIEAVLRDGLLPPDVLELLDLRRQAASTTPSKYQTLVEATSRGRMRGTVQFRGAARTGRDCLAEGTPVLVRDVAGLVFEVPVELITTEHQVWDGCEWVEHDGVVYSGDKNVIEHDGVVATPEHVVYLSDTESTTLGEAKRQCLRLWSGANSPYIN